MSNVRKIERCRLSGTEDLFPILDLGNQALTGIFPQSASEYVDRGPLELVWSRTSGLVQLQHSVNPDAMFGETYGYRSGLNGGMVAHLCEKAVDLATQSGLQPGETVVDIGSNDGTLLNALPVKGVRRIGFDPSGEKYLQYYDSDVELVPSYFSDDKFWHMSHKPAKLVTSIAMFYDLEDPVKFARQVRNILDIDGIWHLEQSYLPSMLQANSYDTICHEHLEYYSLNVLSQILVAAGLEVADVRMNDVNGGSFSVTAVRPDNSAFRRASGVGNWMLSVEERLGLTTDRPYIEFRKRVVEHRLQLRELLETLKLEGKTIHGYGASTKGNVLLQYCDITPELVCVIAEVNEEKFGRVTPGTNIPIVSEAVSKETRPDFYLVLPWHFRSGILRRELEYRASGGRFIFPFPEISVV